MRTATGLTLVAIGAILAFAITSQPPFLNLHVAGFVIALTGVVGIFLPRRGYGWLRRVTTRRGPRGQISRVDVEDVPRPPYLTLNPAAEGPIPPGPEPGDMTMPTTAAAAGTRPIPVFNGQTLATPGEVRLPEETIEEFIEE